MTGGPPPAVRLDMLREAIELIREPHTGREVTHHGRYYTMEKLLPELRAQPCGEEWA